MARHHMQFVTTEPIRTRHRLLWASNLALLIAFCVVAGVYSVSKGTDANWDLKNYHLYSAYAFTNNRMLYDIAPGQLQTYLNPVINLSTYYLMIMLNEKPRLFAFVQGIPAGIYGFVVFRIGVVVASATFGRTLMAYTCAVVATAVGLTGAGFMALVGTSTNDIVTGLLALAALALVMGETASPLPGRWHVGSAGILAGAALAAKLTAVMYCLPLGFIVLTMLGHRAAFTFGISAAIAFLVFWGAHAWQLWWATGNPLFPMYNHIFRSPEWLPTWISGGRNLPRNALEFVFYPFTWAVDQAHVTEMIMRDLRLPVLYCAFAIASMVALARRGSRKAQASGISRGGNARVAMALAGFVVISYGIWMSTFGIYRYAIVLESLTGAGLIAAAAVVFGRSEAKVLALLLAVLAAANVWITRPDWGHVDHAFRVIDVEPLLIPAGALVVIADDWPHGYLVPFLPADVRVVSINNNFIHPGQVYGLNRRISEIVSSHGGAIAVISAPATDEATLQDTLAHYRLRAERCAVVRSNIALEGHRICNGSRF
jgi:hypothetical protein